MKVYILVDNDEEGKPTVDMPIQYGRAARVYTSKGRAKSYARRFNCSVVELDVEKGKVV